MSNTYKCGLSILLAALWVAMAVFFVFLNQIAIYNPVVVIGSLYIMTYVFWNKLRHFVWKKTTAWYKTKDLKSFIKEQSELHFKPMGIQLECETKAYWIAISFDKDNVFEKEIVERRKEYVQYAKNGDKSFIEEM